MDLLTIMDRFNCDDKCREVLESIRWPAGPTCLRCGVIGVPELPVGGVYQCTTCRYQFSVTAGTIMHDTHLPLRKWFLAIYLMCVSKKGISANQMKKMLHIGSYRTAWYLCHRIREAMGNDRLTGPTLLGVVEVDETMVGGKVRGKGRKAGRANKVYVAGAIERGGQVRLKRIPNVRKHTLHAFINETVRDEAEAIYTDELLSYIGIEDANTRHRTVTHSADQWVVGDVHTNSIEGVWSLFKRSIVGSFHKVSLKHIDRYLEELEWRFNNRNNPHIFTDTLRRILTTNALPYRDLVDHEAA